MLHFKLLMFCCYLCILSKSNYPIFCRVMIIINIDLNIYFLFDKTGDHIYFNSFQFIIFYYFFSTFLDLFFLYSFVHSLFLFVFFRHFDINFFGIISFFVILLQVYFGCIYLWILSCIFSFFVCFLQSYFCCILFHILSFTLSTLVCLF